MIVKNTKWEYESKKYDKYCKEIEKVMNKAISEIKPKNQKEIFLLEYYLSSTLHITTVEFCLNKIMHDAKNLRKIK